MQPTFNDFQQNIVSDNSDIFWLIFADYCDENDISHDIREQVNTPKLESWCYEYTYGVVGEVGGIGGRVGIGGSVGGGSVGGIFGSVDSVVGVAGLNWYGVGSNYFEGVGGN